MEKPAGYLYGDFLPERKVAVPSPIFINKVCLDSLCRNASLDEGQCF
jgi:hypothetical protein